MRPPRRLVVELCVVTVAMLGLALVLAEDRRETQQVAQWDKKAQQGAGIAETDTTKQKEADRELQRAVETLEKYEAQISKQQRRKYARRESALKTRRGVTELLPQWLRGRVRWAESLASWLFDGAKRRSSAAWFPLQPAAEEKEKEESVRQAEATVRRLAAAGHRAAQMAAGDMLLYGKYGVAADARSAFAHYEGAASSEGSGSDDGRAQYMVGVYYATGLGGVKQSNALALAYTTQAAARGVTAAEMALAFRYAAGIGVEESCAQAMAHYQSVARKGIAFYLAGPPLGRAAQAPAHRARLADDSGGAYGARTGARALRSAGSRAEFAEIVDYHVQRARKGDVASGATLADLHYHGHRFAPRSYVAALAHVRRLTARLFTRRTELRTGLAPEETRVAAQAAGMLGLMLLRGEGTAVDTGGALRWLRAGAALGHGAALNALGVMHQRGIGVRASADRAAELFRRAADAGHSGGMTNHALTIAATQPQTALASLKRAAAAGHILAHYHLAELRAAAPGAAACRLAVASYRFVAERGDWLHSPLGAAHSSYERGRLAASAVDYVRAAEMGYGVGQLNAALLLERTSHECGFRSSLSANATAAGLCAHSVVGAREAHERLALAYWTRAANQDIADARTKQGDHYFYGWGVARSFERAAAAYVLAANADASGLAMWNVGWMYETGTGLPRDLYMAKRWYDRCAAANEPGKLAASLSLLRLSAKYLWAWVRGEDVGEAPLFFAPAAAAAQEREEKETEEKEKDAGVGNQEDEREPEPDAAAGVDAAAEHDADTDTDTGAWLLGRLDGADRAAVPDVWDQGGAADHDYDLDYDFDHDYAAAAGNSNNNPDGDDDDDGDNSGSFGESVFVVVFLVAAAWMFLPFR
ncbi:ERAD-associated protein [Coemansia sp. RSA 1939]|nr:ERAD-associated protein [Coemansia sp. RSA 1939]KAJ2617649.1 ERAD-associated protein [Coemansia sp. RSA 1804]KAJ2695453.1 ERAD-associated protein [Coemansia sp. RSA 1285]